MTTEREVRAAPNDHLQIFTGTTKEKVKDFMIALTELLIFLICSFRFFLKKNPVSCCLDSQMLPVNARQLELFSLYQMWKFLYHFVEENAEVFMNIVLS